VTAPTLTSPTDAANGATAATGSVSTDEGNGTLWWVVSTSGTAPTKAQVKAGQDHTGASAANAGSQAVSATGVQTLSPAPSGLTASTAYTIHFMHEDAAANQSTVASGDGFTTAAGGGITIVGWKAVGANSGSNAVVSLTALVDGSASAAATGDEVILVAAGSSGIDAAPSGPDGTWTEIIANIFINDSFKSNLRAWRKRMGAVPDTSVTVSLVNNSAGGGGAIAVVARGVDAATALDVAVVTTSDVNSAMVNPPAITPVSAGALILAGGFGSSDTTPTAFTGPANMTGFHQAQGAGSTRGGVIGAAVKTDWTAGAFDPDAFTGGETSVSCSWIGFSIALRPA
jgi:hypothetical protein